MYKFLPKLRSRILFVAIFLASTFIILSSQINIKIAFAKNFENEDPYAVLECAKYCAYECNQAQEKEYVRFLYPKAYEICKKDQTYEGLVSCTSACLKEYDYDNSGADFLRWDCKNCFKDKTCTDNYTSDIYLNACTAVKKGRDLVEFWKTTASQRNKEAKGEQISCPQGAEPTKDGKDCVCKNQGEVFDSLYTTCLDKAKSVSNIKELLELLPDDMRDAIKKKAQEEISAVLNKTTGNVSKDLQDDINLMAGAVINKIMDEQTLANLIFKNLIQNTQNLKDLIRYLGRTNTEKLIDLLNQIIQGLHQAEPPKPSEQPASTSQPQSQGGDPELRKKLQDIRDKQEQLAEEKKKPCDEANKNGAGHPGCWDSKGNFDSDCAEKVDAARSCFVCNKDSDCEGVFASVGFKARCDTTLKTSHSCEAIIPEGTKF